MMPLTFLLQSQSVVDDPMISLALNSFTAPPDFR
jgi:hypothetical protein